MKCTNDNSQYIEDLPRGKIVAMVLLGESGWFDEGCMDDKWVTFTTF